MNDQKITLILLLIFFTLMGCRKDIKGVYEVKSEFHSNGLSNPTHDEYLRFLEYFAYLPIESESEYLNSMLNDPTNYTLIHYPNKTSADLGYTYSETISHFYHKDGKNLPGANGYFSNFGGNGNCDQSTYVSPSNDTDLDIFCKQIWNMVECDGYSHTSQEVIQICATYNSYENNWVGPSMFPRCQYCP